MERIEVSEALTFWTAPHPSWRPNPEWPEAVGFETWQSGDVCVFVDPLLRDDLDPGVWQEFDSRVSEVALTVVLLTAPWHERSVRAVSARYDAPVWIHPQGRDRVADLPALTELPAGIDVFVPGGMNEGQAAFHIAAERALIVAEFFLGTEDGLRILEAPCLVDRDAFAASLDQLLHLPIDHVLVAHGTPVISTGGGAVRDAVAAFRR